MQEGDGHACGVHPGESLPGFLPGALEHDAGGDEKGKESVDGGGYAAEVKEDRRNGGRVFADDAASDA